MVNISRRTLYPLTQIGMSNRKDGMSNLDWDYDEKDNLYGHLSLYTTNYDEETKEVPLSFSLPQLGMMIKKLQGYKEHSLKDPESDLIGINSNSFIPKEGFHNIFLIITLNSGLSPMLHFHKTVASFHQVSGR